MLEAGVLYCVKLHTGLCDLYTLNSHISCMGYESVVKVCRKCGILKMSDDFCIDRSSKDGRNRKCRSCAKAYMDQRNYEPVMHGEKSCTQCGALQPVDRFAVSRVYSDGRATWCKSCTNEYNRAKFYQPTTTGSKQCSKCKETKDVSLFPANRSRTDGRDGRCLDCAKVHSAKYFRTPAGRLSHKRGGHARRARTIQATGNYTSDQLSAVYDRHESCIYCQTHLEHNEKTIDHVVPLAGGGSNFAQNLVVACRSCNSSKCDADPTEWCTTRLGHVPEAIQDALEFHYMVTHPDELVLAA